MSDLHALLHRASQVAEREFNKRGELAQMIWLTETPDGRQDIFFNAANSADGKERLAAKMRELMRERGVQRYAIAMECWIDHDDEAVVVTAHDRHEAVMGFRDIIRTNGDVALGNLDRIAPVMEATGRFWGLLGPKRPNAVH
jgi:hypothetical protein